MIPERLLGSPRTLAVHLSTTSRCNLRCVYCDVSAPGHVGADFDFSRFDRVLSLLSERQVLSVSFYGEGETTFVPDWEQHLAKLHEAGLRTAVVTNLARKLSAREIEVLLSVNDLYVSCDTTDSDVFRQTRTGNVAVLLQNMVALQGMSIERNGRVKDLTWHCVLNTMSCRTLVSWVASGVVLGVSRFSLGQLLEKEHNTLVSCITTLPDAECRACLRLVEEARALAERNGRCFEVQAGFAQLLDRRAAELAREGGLAD